MTAPTVGLVLCSNPTQPIPSTRIAILNMLPFVHAAGIHTPVLFAPPQPTETPELSEVVARAVAAGCQTVVFQKVHGDGAVAVARRLRAAGIRTVYVVCDLVDIPMAQATDATVVVTQYLKSLYPAALQERIHVVHDGIERPSLYKTEWTPGSGSRHQPLHAVLVTSAHLLALPVLGHPPAWLRVQIVGRYTRGARKWRELRWAWAELDLPARLRYLRFLMDHRIDCVPWDAEGVYRTLRQSDIALIPVETNHAAAEANTPPAWKVKSENRLTLKMAMGLPVIATPIPAYEAVIEHGHNGFFARSPRDWSRCLTALRDPARRQAMGMAARASVSAPYSMEEQAHKLLQMLQVLPGLGDALLPHS